VQVLTQEQLQEPAVQAVHPEQRMNTNIASMEELHIALIQTEQQLPPQEQQEASLFNRAERVEATVVQLQHGVL
jgi:hypothetical protein